jgi:hypothetical protein
MLAAATFVPRERKPMIRNMLQFAAAVLAVAVLVAVPGCGDSKAPASKAPAGHTTGDGHDHSKDKAGHSEGDGHDHSKDKADQK